MQPTVTDLHLDWQLSGGPCELVQMPKEMPSLFAGDRLILYAMALKDKVGSDSFITDHMSLITNFIRVCNLALQCSIL